MSIVAVGAKNRLGEPSDTISQYTDVDGPSPPVIMNATCIPGTSGTSIFLQWATPEYFNKSVDQYFISIAEEYKDFQKLNITLPKDNLNSNVCEKLMFEE